MAIPPTQIILGFVCLVVIYSVTKSIYKSVSRRRKARALGCLPPRYIPSRLFGWYDYKEAVKAVREWRFLDLMCEKFLERGNTYQTKTLLGNVIATTEPDNIKAMLATQFSDFSLGGRHDLFYPLLGDGIFTLDGPAWSHLRTMLRPQFSREQIADVGMLRDHVSQLIALIPSDGHTEVDVQDLFFRLTLDTATEFLFGESTNCLVEGHQGRAASSALAGVGGEQGFAHAFNKSLDFLSSRARAQSFYWLVNDKESLSYVKKVHDVVDYYVDRALARRHSEAKSSTFSRYVFIDAMVSVTQDRKSLRDQMLNILLAGRDTTASLLSASFYYLARHQRVWKRLREEITSQFPPEDDADEDEITLSRIRDIRYLKHFLNEVLRLLPPVPVNSRYAVVDTTLPVGGGPDGKSPIFIPKGQRVMYAVHYMHRRTDLWGDDALDFRPERWEESERHSWEYLPFNGGPRICLGQQYALAEASYVIVRLLRRFETIENAQPEIVSPKLRVSLTTSAAFGTKVMLFASEKQ